MDHGPGIPFFQELLAFLVATVIVVPVFQRLRISPIIGFLGLGVIVGPSGIGLVGDPEGVRALAELGIMFLLYLLGLDMVPRQLWRMLGEALTSPERAAWRRKPAPISGCPSRGWKAM